MEAIILVGGMGTRLRPYTWILPKPLLPLGEISILEITLRRLANYGYTNVTLAVGHKASFIKHVVSEIQGLPFQRSEHLASRLVEPCISSSVR